MSIFLSALFCWTGQKLDFVYYAFIYSQVKQTLWSKDNFKENFKDNFKENTRDNFREIAKDILKDIL